MATDGTGGPAGAWRGVIEEYRPYLPVTPDTPVVTLLEGATPLLRAGRLMRHLPGLEIFLKYEGQNPTGSFKDRGMTVAMSKALEDASRAVVCASTGNTAAAAAAYASRAGIPCFVVVPAGGVAVGKLVQAMAHGARVVPIEGSFDQALRVVRDAAPRLRLTLVNSVNPYRIEGQKTGAFEVCDALRRAPDVLAIPVGNAGNITAYWRGFVQYHRLGRIASLPKMWGFQAAGAAPLVHGAPVPNPETIASAIRIGNPARWEDAMDAMSSSGGAVNAVPDSEILAAYRFLATSEGVFCEPASAASVAGLLAHGAGGAERIVCVLTGHGLKDPQTALEHAGAVVPCDPTLEAIERAVLG